MTEPIRILHVLGQLNIGGAESRIMDLYRIMDKEKVQFDFVVHGDTQGYYENEIISLGGNVYHIPRFRMVNYLQYKSAWRKLLSSLQNEDKTSKIKMIQGHMTSTGSIYLPMAHEYGIQTSIAHARSAGVDSGIKGRLTKFLRRNISQKADYLFTCSQIAGISVFGKKAVESGKTIFIPNAIDVSKFKYDPSERNRMRKELLIDDRMVIGHVGSFRYAKNHEYVLQVFKEILDRYPEHQHKRGFEDWNNKKPVLILLGEGSRLVQMKAQAEELGIANDVLFLGAHMNIQRYYNTMDLFIYPSRYEGLPGAVVEAQASGLKCIMSSQICDEVVATDLVTTMDIEEKPSVWAEKALELITQRTVRSSYSEMVGEAGFRASDQAERLTKFYLSGDVKYVRTDTKEPRS